jgi:OOP family OmpA-OmpF porin
MERITLSASSLFASGKSELGSDKTELNKLASLLKQYPETGDIQVDGYTDRLGNAKANVTLSQKRADAVKAYLVSQGVPADRINTSGKGSANPVSKCDSVKKHAALVQCLAPDRRIEIEPITIQRKVK